MEDYNLRIPTINNFGIKYHDFLVNIILLTTEIGFELNVVRKVNEVINKYEKKLFDITKSDYKSFKNIFSENKENYHVQVIGKFSLASIFPSKSFGVSEAVASVINVTSNHTIIGSFPIIDEKYEKFYKNINFNLEYLFIKTDNCLKFPFVGICQMQKTGIVNTSCGAALTLPLLKVVDNIVEKLKIKYNNHSISVSYIDCFNWNDSCFIIRSNNVNCIAEIVDNIRSISFAHIYKAIDSININQLDNTIDSIKHSFDRIDRIIKKISGINKLYEQANVFELNNHIFTQSLTAIGILWFVASTYYKDQTILNDDKVQLSGDIYLETRLKIRPGHDSIILNFLKELSSDNDIGSVIHYENRSFVFGEASLFVSWYSVDELGKKIPIQIDVYLNIIFKLRNILLKKSKKFNNVINSLIEMVTDIQVVLDDNGNNLNISNIMPINSMYGNSVLASKNFDIESVIDSLKKQKISRYLRRALANRLSLWREKLVDHTMSSQMIELADFYISWKKILEQYIINKAPTVYIEDHVKFFLKPFGISISQRYLESSQMIFSNDLSMEFKGGFSKILTAFDGLSKSCLCLISGPGNNGSMTTLSVGSNASIIYRNYNKRKLDKCYNLSTISLNRDHLVHPIKITTFFHENIHVIIKTNDFFELIKKHNKNFYYKPVGTSKDSSFFLNDRLDEIATEFMLSYLIFKNNPILYCKVYLSKLNVDSDFNSSDIDDNEFIKLRSEHVLRCYIVYKMLLLINNDKFSVKEKDKFKSNFRNYLLEGFNDWYNLLKRYLFFENINNYIKDDIGILKYNLVEAFLVRKKFLNSVFDVIFIIDEFFNNDKDNDSLIRNNFYNTLSVCINEYLFDVKSMMSTGNDLSSSINFYFSSVNNRSSIKSLRIRRLESLIGYILIIRSFHELIDSWIDNNNSGSIYLIRDEEGEIDFQVNYSDIAFDKTWGTIFILDKNYLNKYNSLRISFLKSMWHLSEVTKHSDMMNLLE